MFLPPLGRLKAALFSLLVFSILPACGTDPRPDTDIFSDRRRALVDELRQEGIRDESVLRAIGSVPRHLFVPGYLSLLAYANHPLPIGHDQTISQPYIVAAMTEAALTGRDSRRMRVLEIGTGSGYQAAVLSVLVKEVYTIEIVPDLAKSAEARLKELGYRNVFVLAGDGYKGWPTKAPFDVIIVTAAPPEIPAELVRQLARSGHMVVPVGDLAENQTLTLIEKSDTGAVSIVPLLPVRFVPMVHGDTE